MSASPPHGGVSNVVETYPNGDRYEGNIGQDGAKSGWGKYTFANGSTYEGFWRAGKMDGWGEFTEQETGDRFRGEWELANRKFGIYFYANGDMYQGGFDQSMKHGRGVIWENKEMYEAQYDRDRLISKVPWRSVRADPDTASHAASAPGGPPVGGEVYRELEELRRRCGDAEDRASVQQTQLAVLTKELQQLQDENAQMRGGRGGSPPPPRGRSGTRGRPTERSYSAGGPRGRSSGATGGRARDDSRYDGATAAERLYPQQPAGAGGPPRGRRSGSKVCYRQRRNGPAFNTMNESVLREQFRYYY